MRIGDLLGSGGMAWRHPLGLVAILLLALSAPASAHRLQVFATAEGHQIRGSTYFARGSAATGARIEVLDPQGELLAELTPDAQGRFVYPTTAPIDHRIRVHAGDGHQAEWLIKAEELSGGFVRVATGEQGMADTSPITPTAPGAPVPPIEPSGGDQQEHEVVPVATLDPALEAAIERAVARQMRPLREQLMAAEDRIRLSDILGALGYILGLTGFAIWWSHRRRR